MSDEAPRWTERSIASAVARQMFGSRSVLVVPNCTWTGSECDLLVVDARSLRVVDVEIKTSRADLRADAKKAKWWHQPWHHTSRHRERLPDARLGWPARVWKHYYVMPAEIYCERLLGEINAASGVVVVARASGACLELRTVRRARPNPAARAITAGEAVAIARLASLRMWDAIRDR